MIVTWSCDCVCGTVRFLCSIIQDHIPTADQLIVAKHDITQQAMDEGWKDFQQGRGGIVLNRGATGSADRNQFAEDTFYTVQHDIDDILDGTLGESAKVRTTAYASFTLSVLS